LFFYDNQLIAYFALCGDAIRLSTREKARILGEHPKLAYEDYPALKITRLAVCSDYQSHGIGRYLLNGIVGFSQDINEEFGVAFKFIAVDAKNDERSIRFYRDYGFVENMSAYEAPEKPDEPISMRFLIEDREEVLDA
jgi:GNAT superfamily N-acetyltransferase